MSALRVYPPLPSISELVAEKVKIMDQATDLKIAAGFEYELDGVQYHVSYHADDQANFSAALNGANLSQTLGNMDAAARQAAFGNDLPVALPDSWVMGWRLHPVDGSPAVTHVFDLKGFLKLAAASAKHLQDCLTFGWGVKAQLAACQTKAELEAKAAELDLDGMLRAARAL